MSNKPLVATCEIKFSPKEKPIAPGTVIDDKLAGKLKPNGIKALLRSGSLREEEVRVIETEKAEKAVADEDVAAAISELKPIEESPDQWRADGAPDANYLSDVLDARISAAQRDRVWASHPKNPALKPNK